MAPTSPAITINSSTKPFCKQPNGSRIKASANKTTQNRNNQHFHRKKICLAAKGKLLLVKTPEVDSSESP